MRLFALAFNVLRRLNWDTPGHCKRIEQNVTTLSVERLKFQSFSLDGCTMEKVEDEREDIELGPNVVFSLNCHSFAITMTRGMSTSEHASQVVGPVSNWGPGAVCQGYILEYQHAACSIEHWLGSGLHSTSSPTPQQSERHHF